MSDYYLIKASTGERAALDDRPLGALVLRYAGDDGMTVKGTADAMGFMQQLRGLDPGEELPLPRMKNWAIGKAVPDES